MRNSSRPTASHVRATVWNSRRERVIFLSLFFGHFPFSERTCGVEHWISSHQHAFPTSCIDNTSRQASSSRPADTRCYTMQYYAIMRALSSKHGHVHLYQAVAMRAMACLCFLTWHDVLNSIAWPSLAHREYSIARLRFERCGTVGHKHNATSLPGAPAISRTLCPPAGSATACTQHGAPRQQAARA